MQKKFTPEKLLDMIRQMAKRHANMTPLEITIKRIEEDDLMRFRVITGLPEQKALEAKASLKCPLRRATDYYARMGKLPDEFHQLLLRRYEAWEIFPQLHGIGYSLN